MDAMVLVCKEAFPGVFRQPDQVSMARRGRAPARQIDRRPPRVAVILINENTTVNLLPEENDPNPGSRQSSNRKPGEAAAPQPGSGPLKQKTAEECTSQKGCARAGRVRGNGPLVMNPNPAEAKPTPESGFSCLARDGGSIEPSGFEERARGRQAAMQRRAHRRKGPATAKQSQPKAHPQTAQTMKIDVTEVQPHPIHFGQDRHSCRYCPIGKRRLGQVGVIFKLWNPPVAGLEHFASSFAIAALSGFI